MAQLHWPSHLCHRLEGLCFGYSLEKFLLHPAFLRKAEKHSWTKFFLTETNWSNQMWNSESNFYWFFKIRKWFEPRSWVEPWEWLICNQGRSLKEVICFNLPYLAWWWAVEFRAVLRLAFSRAKCQLHVLDCYDWINCPSAFVLIG